MDPEPTNTASAPRGRPRKRETYSISFRVDTGHLKELNRGAEELGLSVHEYARVVLYRAIDREAESRILEGIEDTKRDVRTLRAEMLEAVHLIITNVVDDEEEPGQIRAAVERAFHQGGDGRR